MPATVRSDTSCLIIFDKIGELQLLEKLFENITITQTVEAEFGKPLPHWITVQNANDIKTQLVLEIFVDSGEASAIALALEMKDCLLIIDELKGRKLATKLGITITGTLGVMALAKQQGYIPMLKPLLARINQTDFRLSEELVLETLKKVGE